MTKEIRIVSEAKLPAFQSDMDGRVLVHMARATIERVQELLGVEEVPPEDLAMEREKLGYIELFYAPIYALNDMVEDKEIAALPFVSSEKMTDMATVYLDIYLDSLREKSLLPDDVVGSWRDTLIGEMRAAVLDSINHISPQQAAGRGR